MDVDPDDNDISQNLLAHFICAGTSALILSISHIHPECWFISFFALIPFLWRLKRAGLFGSILLGFIMAVCYAFVALTGEALTAPGSFLLNLLFLSLVFSTFGIAVNRIKTYIGFNPVFIAALWLPLEYILTHYTALGSIFSLSNAGSGFVVRFGSLFGFLMISFFIVLINSISILIIEYAGRKFISTVKSKTRCPATDFAIFESIKSTKRWAYLPDLRAPPLPC
jgi:hypothetical protein